MSDLASGGFLEQQRNVVLIGGTGSAKRLLADTMLDNVVLKDLLGKN